MPVRLRITFLFTASVFSILLIVDVMVYYISSQSRLSLVKTRLTNRAKNTASLLKQSEIFNSQLIQKIDTSTSVSVRDKEIQVYDNNDHKIYAYSDRPADTLVIDTAILRAARNKNSIYFTKAKKEAIALYNAEAGLVIISATSDEPGKKNLFQLMMILLLSLIGGTIISLGGGYFFASRLLRPIRNIADKVNDISAKNLAQRIHTSTARDEWHYLSTTLNELLNRLQDSFDMHRRFISNASHELSTPLTSISNQLEVSLQRKREAEEYRNVMVSVHQDVLHMNKLTQTLLEFAKASGDSVGLEIEPVRVDEIILQLPAELAKIESGYAVLLEFNELPEDEDQLLVFGNEELLFSAVKNIVINACKYSHNHSALVKLKGNAKEVTIVIIDDGPGISPQEIGNIFQPFYRGDSVGSVNGFGLGLSLANRIIKLHKGRIDVKSDIMTGTIFTIRLPVSLRHVEQDI
jgi:two-component system, OmpR family, sensor histidine kinase ArlS